jgi:hypothetical protein
MSRQAITGGSHGKTWQSVPADQVARDDIVPRVGLVVQVQVVKGQYTGPVVVLIGAGGNRMVANPAAAVRVFRRSEGR